MSLRSAELSHAGLVRYRHGRDNKLPVASCNLLEQLPTSLIVLRSTMLHMCDLFMHNLDMAVFK